VSKERELEARVQALEARIGNVEDALYPRLKAVEALIKNMKSDVDEAVGKIHATDVACAGYRDAVAHVEDETQKIWMHLIPVMEKVFPGKTDSIVDFLGFPKNVPKKGWTKLLVKKPIEARILDLEDFAQRAKNRIKRIDSDFSAVESRRDRDNLFVLEIRDECRNIWMHLMPVVEKVFPGIADDLKRTARFCERDPSGKKPLDKPQN
jgi:hypothetical protein